MTAFTQFIPLPGTERAAPDATRLATLSTNDELTVTVRIRRKRPLATLTSLVAEPISQRQYTNQYGAAPSAVRRVVAFAEAYGLTVVKKSAARRSVWLKGTVRQMEKAFDVSLSAYQTAGGQVFRGRSGSIHVPLELVDDLEGVFGLDDRPQAQAHFQVYTPPAGSSDAIVARAASASFTPPQLASLYAYPTGVTGSGQTIAIIELGGGFRRADLTAYFGGLSLKTPTVTAVLIDGGKNAPSTADSADGEVMLDIEVAGAIAPGARIVVYFAPNTDQGFLDAITAATHDTKNKPSVISISWGAAESRWTPQALDSFNQAFQAAAVLGITVCAAAGDTGSDDSVGDGKAHVDFPSSSPFVLACGGTKLSASGTTIASEVVWHESPTSATGGGISDVFDLPDYQRKSGVPASVNTGRRVGRGVPDVAAVADPATGYQVRVDGSNLVIGGTSAVAPLMAGLVALINQQRGRSVGFMHPLIYAQPAAFRDITQGNNNTTSAGTGYSAGKGWDACTGLGVADGQKLSGVFPTPTVA